MYRIHLFGFVLVLFTLCIGSTDAYSAVVNSSKPSSLNSGLVGYWTFDGKDMIPNVRDVSGRGNHGYLSGQISTSSSLGKVGQALMFDGTNDYVNISNESQFDFERTDPFSISAWVMFQNTSFSGPIFVKKFNGGSFPGIDYNIDATNRRLIFKLTSVDGGANTLEVRTPASGLNRGVWFHTVLTYDGSSSATGVKIYVNGVSQTLTTSSDALTSSILHDTAPTLGRNIPGSTALSGALDDVRVYNRVLTENEVRSIYRSGSFQSGVSRSVDALSNGLVAHWTLDGSKTLTNISDSSGNGNHLRFVGSKGTTTVSGKIGQALQFNRLNGDNLRTESAVNLTSSNVLTVSMWVYVNEFNNDDAMAFESSVNLNNNDGAAGFTLHSGTPCSGYINVSIQDSTSSSKYRIECFNRPTAKEWHHYVTIYDNSSTQGDVRLFIDGVEQNSVSMPINTKDQASGLGNYTWYLMSRSGTIQYASGRLDDVRVYNRTLSDAEIKSLYNLGAGTKTNTSLSQKNVNSSGLVGHWTFDGSKMTSNVADSSGNGNHGYLQGQISTTTKIGKIGQSIQFDGIDDRVNVPDSSQFTISGPFAVSAWIKMNNASGFRLVSKATIAATQAEWGMGTSGAGSAYYFQLYSGGSAANNCSANVTSAATGDVNTWVHLLVQYSGSGGCGGISIYRNGEIQSVTTVNSGSGFSSFSNTSAPVNIGALFNDDPTYKSYARGLIDDVRIFNRTLSSTEIRQLYLLGN